MQDTDARGTDILPGADVFLRLSAAGVLPAQRLGGLATRPLIIALANPEPEIVPDAAKTARPDAIIATGRSDYPNQVNDVPVFPFVFRGALDVAARADQRANERCRRKRAGRACQGGAVRHCCPAACNPEPALRSGVPDSEAAHCRLVESDAPAVAKEAMDTGVAGRPNVHFAAYREKLTQFVYQPGLLMNSCSRRPRRRPSASSSPGARTNSRRRGPPSCSSTRGFGSRS